LVFEFVVLTAGWSGGVRLVTWDEIDAAEAVLFRVNYFCR